MPLQHMIPEWLENANNYYAIVTDLQGNYAHVNAHFKQRFSFITTDFVGMPYYTAVHPDDIPKCAQAAQTCIVNPHQPVTVQIRKPIDDQGNFFWTNWEFSAHFQDGALQGILCVGYDISPEKNAAKALHHSQDLLKAMLDSASDSNILIGTDYCILSFNKVADRNVATFYNQSLSIGQDFRTFLMPETTEAFYSSFQKALQGEKTVSDWEFKRNNQSAWFCISYYPVYNQEGTIFGVAFTSVDIDHRKRMELRIQAQHEKLKQIAWTQCHDVRGPLTSIMAVIYLIKTDTDPAHQAEYLQLLTTAVEQFDDSIKNIVSTIRSEDNDEELTN